MGLVTFNVVTLGNKDVSAIYLGKQFAITHVF